MKSMSLATLAAPVLLALSLLPGPAAAQNDAGYEITPRLNIVGGSGRPTNDILGFGVALQRRLDNGWYLGFNVDYSPAFDFEEPYLILDIPRAPEIVDAEGTMLLLTVVGERRYPLKRPGWIGFWNLGGGIAEVDLEDVDGQRGDGGRFDIETDAGSEWILVAGAGFLQRLGPGWSARYELTFEYHIADWDLRDRVNGITGEIDDYDIYGLRIGVSRQF